MRDDGGYNNEELPCTDVDACRPRVTACNAHSACLHLDWMALVQVMSLHVRTASQAEREGDRYVSVRAGYQSRRSANSHVQTAAVRAMYGRRVPLIYLFVVVVVWIPPLALRMPVPLAQLLVRLVLVDALFVCSAFPAVHDADHPAVLGAAAPAVLRTRLRDGLDGLVNALVRLNLPLKTHVGRDAEPPILDILEGFLVRTVHPRHYVGDPARCDRKDG